MQVLYARCAGLDVHKDTVVACVRIHGDKPQREIREFGTTTGALTELAEWLLEHQCTQVAMEATGAYWRPVWHVLEATEGSDGLAFALVLANAAHIKNVPGRKTDVNDATWIADLLAHGLIRASFVPPTEIQDLRTLLRTRKQLVRERVQHVQRIQKTLEDANIKVASFIADITGTSGRAILRALIDGETRPERLLALTTGRLQGDRKDLLASLKGHVRAAHRFLLKLHLDQIEVLERSVQTVDEEAGTLLQPFRDHAERLKTIPGVSDVAAQAIVSEIGVDMSRFATAGHLLSWAGLCPRNDESAGKRRSTRLRDGNTWIKTLLVQCAWAAVRCKTGYLRAQYQRLKHRGSKKAIIAVAASILRATFYMLRDRTEYRELGGDHFDKLDKDRAVARLLKRLERLGVSVRLTAAPAQ